jgi:hypothetical protein
MALGNGVKYFLMTVLLKSMKMGGLKKIILNNATSFVDYQGLISLTKTSGFFCADKMRSFLQCSNWANSKQRLAKSAQI